MLQTPMVQHVLPDEDEQVDVAGIDYVSIPTCKLQRSIDFYTRLFGFHIVEDGRRHERPHVLMLRGNVYVAIHEHGGRPPAELPVRRWSFVVLNVDHVREIVWDHGVATADGSDEPRRMQSWRATRSFLISDPDGHQIELVERPFVRSSE